MKTAALLGIAAVMAAGLAHAETVNLTWVPISENPATAGVNSTAHGTITLSISPWTLTPISGNGLGPNLFGVVGRKSASVAGFEYSGPLKASGITWSTNASLTLSADEQTTQSYD